MNVHGVNTVFLQKKHPIPNEHIGVRASRRKKDSVAMSVLTGFRLYTTCLQCRCCVIPWPAREVRVRPILNIRSFFCKNTVPTPLTPSAFLVGRYTVEFFIEKAPVELKRSPKVFPETGFENWALWADTDFVIVSYFVGLRMPSATHINGVTTLRTRS